MDLVLNRLEKYYCNNKNELAMITNHIIIQKDPSVLFFYNQLFENKLEHLLIVADVYTIIYFVIKNIYSSSCLLDIKYQDKKPSAGVVFGDDLSLLASVSQLFTIVSKLNEFIINEYPEKIQELFNETNILHVINDIQLTNSKDINKQNLQKINDNLKSFFTKYIKVLS